MIAESLHDRWEALGQRLDCPGLDSRYAELDARYTEPHRAYHTWTHIAECIDVWRKCAEPTEGPAEFELALWLHDAIYRPLRSDNEERSAVLAVEWLRGCPTSLVDPARVRELILATRHPATAETSDEALIQDVDLHILGAPRPRYEEYEAQVRREYRIVPRALFRRRRAALLRSFLDSDQLYNTAWFQEQFELAARRNLKWALEQLGG